MDADGSSNIVPVGGLSQQLVSEIAASTPLFLCPTGDGEADPTNVADQPIVMSGSLLQGA